MAKLKLTKSAVDAAQQRMFSRHRHHQRIVPCGHGKQAIAHIIGLRESRIVEVFAQPRDLLRQRYLGQMNPDFGIIVPTLRQEGAQARRRDAVGQGNAQLAVVTGGDRLGPFAGLLQGSEDARHMLLENLPGTRMNSRTPRSSSSSLIARDNGDCSMCSFSAARAK